MVQHIDVLERLISEGKAETISHTEQMIAVAGKRAKKGRANFKIDNEQAKDLLNKKGIGNRLLFIVSVDKEEFYNTGRQLVHEEEA